MEKSLCIFNGMISPPVICEHEIESIPLPCDAMGFLLNAKCNACATHFIQWFWSPLTTEPLCKSKPTAKDMNELLKASLTPSYLLSHDCKLGSRNSRPVQLSMESETAMRVFWMLFKSIIYKGFRVFSGTFNNFMLWKECKSCYLALHCPDVTDCKKLECA